MAANDDDGPYQRRSGADPVTPIPTPGSASAVANCCPTICVEGPPLVRIKRFARPPGPCDGCHRAERCTAEQICCEAFALFARLDGDSHSAARWALAPRQPSALILERLLAGRRQLSDAERQRARNELAIKMQRDANC